MISFLKAVSHRFRKEEEGSMTVEFAIYFTIFFTILTASFEIAYINLRHAMLERAVDVITRDLRLSTGADMDYASVKTAICDAASIIKDCEANLMLEMIEVDPRNVTTVDPNPDCRNAEEEVRPARTFTPGLDNDLMLMRACLKYKPMMPSTQFGKQLNLDSNGYAQLIVNTAFVQEPR
jgi:hypothetical protein